MTLHYGRGYDFHHILQILATITNEKIEVIPNNQENYITFSIGQLQFIDSTQFSLLSLEQMATNLRNGKSTPAE